MGLPIHLLGHEYQDRWIETLRRELDGHATVEVVSDLDVERQSVYVVGDCGHFVLFQEPAYPRGILLMMFPFLCSAKKYGQGMVNLEERIHRALDTMSVALKPEAVERYEKSRWTRFFRIFGWEHVGSLDFAHRPKTEIVETKDDVEPPKNPCCSSCLIRIKPEFQATWSIMFKERLEGKAIVRQEQGSLRTIVSPNGRYRVDTSTSIWIESAHRHYYNVQGELNGRDYRISWPFGAMEEAEYGRVGRSDLDREIIRLYQEIVMNEPPTTEFMASDKSPTRIYGKTRSLWFFVLFFGYLTALACIGGPLFLFDVIKSASGKPGYEAGILMTLIGFLFLLPILISPLSRLLVRQWPMIQLDAEGIQIRSIENPCAMMPSSVLAELRNSLWHSITLQKYNMKTVFLRWSEIIGLWTTSDKLIILGGTDSGEPVAFSYGNNAFGISLKQVGEALIAAYKKYVPGPLKPRFLSIVPIFDRKINKLLRKFDQCGGVLEYFVFRCDSETSELERHRLIAIETLRFAVSKCNEHFRISHQKYRKEIQKALQKQKKRLEAQGVDTNGFIESRSKVPVWRVDIDAIEHDTPISLDLATFFGGDTIHSAKNQEWFTIDNHSYLYAFLQPPHGLRPPHDDPAERKTEWNANSSTSTIYFLEMKQGEHELLCQVNEALFGELEKLEIFRWNTDCSEYFDAGKEYWGTYFWTVYSPQYDWYVGILGSTTD